MNIIELKELQDIATSIRGLRNQIADLGLDTDDDDLSKNALSIHRSLRNVENEINDAIESH